MIDELCVIGHPSRLGGADTELDHQIRVWQRMGLTVHICHTGELDDNLLSMDMEARGCVYHEPRDWSSLDGLHCISFCNGEFLKEAHRIRDHARSTSFVNCMTWNFDAELAAQEAGNIDFHLYQTRHQFERVSPKLQAAGSYPYRHAFFTPYFHANQFPYIDDRPQDKFRFGRISRGDADKFNHRQLWIYETMTAPVLKEGIILGWDDRARRVFERFDPAPWISGMPEGAMSQQDFYRHCEAVIMATNTFENLPRVGMEAMASGSILIVDDRGGWRSLIDDGRTGWLCKNDREFVYKASRCAFEAEERAAMRLAAAEQLGHRFGMAPSQRSWAEVFDQWEALR